MMILTRFLPAAVLLMALPAGAHALQNLDDSALGEVSGREGIVVGLELYFNTQKSMDVQLDGTPLGVTLATLPTNPDGSCSGAVLNNNCRLGIQIAGRDARNLDNTKIGGASAAQAVQGEWLMFKDSYFSVKMPDLYLDGSFMGSGANAALSSAVGYEYFLDVPRFQDSFGTCLLSNGAGTSCTASNVRANPALVLYQYHGSDGNGGTTYSFNSGTGKGSSSGYDDLSIGLKIGRMAVEYDTGACPLTGAAACGYNQDVNNSFMGISIRDNNSAFAGIAIGGKMYMYGF